jgi:hypothetical protein
VWTLHGLCNYNMEVDTFRNGVKGSLGFFDLEGRRDLRLFDCTKIVQNCGCSVAERKRNTQKQPHGRERRETLTH